MKKFFLSFFVFAASFGYVVSQSFGNSVSASGATLSTTTSKDKTTQIPASLPTTQPAPVASPVAVVIQKPPKVVTKTPTPAPTPTPVPVPVPTPVVPTPPPAIKPKGQYVDGTYTGSVEDAYYGMVQVEASISGGRLANVKFLQYPNDRRTSQQINNQAMPLLIEEAIQAQSADVSGVSGASETSPAFIRSLTTALTQAKNS